MKWRCIWWGFNRDKTWHGCLVRNLHRENVCASASVKKSESYGEEMENEREGG